MGVICNSLQVAHQVAALVDNSFLIKSFSNGREQGLCITNYPRTACVAENRNSDEIVVYYGNSSDFDITTNLPSEKVYEEAEYFGNGDFEAAAKFISDFLKG